MIKEFNTPKDFCRFMQNFEGELTVKHNQIYHKGVLIAVFNKTI